MRRYLVAWLSPRAARSYICPRLFGVVREPPPADPVLAELDAKIAAGDKEH